MKKLISIVCPVYNEEKAIPLFYQRLKGVLNGLPAYDFEVIFTNNRSSDHSLLEIQKIQKNDNSVHHLTFSRNFGYQPSILAGVTYSKGDAVIIIDVDCEDPPELIPEFVKRWEEGYDVCYGLRGRRQEARWITWLRLLFYRVLKFTADTDIILDMAEFSLMSRTVRNVLIKNTNTFPFLRAEIAYSGFKKVGIPYDRQKRIIGETHYNLYGMVLFAVAGILSISTFPLRVPVYFLPFIALINIAALVMERSGAGTWFHEVIVLDAIYLMLLMTVQGLYIARIYKNGIGRPVYIVDWEQSDPRLRLGV